jgi:hypothetical protein
MTAISATAIHSPNWMRLKTERKRPESDINKLKDVFKEQTSAGNYV